MSQWEGVMQHHAKSFYLASLFFPKHLLPRVKALYALCRWLDDAVDEAPDVDSANKALLAISNDLESKSPAMPVNQLYRKNRLQVGYMQDLIDGAKDDLKTVRIKDQAELIQYSYKVAGTVGLAMFDLMDVSPKQARANAVDLGIAMQITNICRDVKEDLKRDRIYLPLDLLEHYDISEEQFLSGDYHDWQLVAAMQDMLKLADTYYFSAQLAYKNIPWRSRGATIIASNLYRSIGMKLLKKGGNPMLGRTYLNGLEKTWVVLKSLGSWLVSGFKSNHLSHDDQLHQALKPWKQLRGFSS